MKPTPATASAPWFGVTSDGLIAMRGVLDNSDDVGLGVTVGLLDEVNVLVGSHPELGLGVRVGVTLGGTVGDIFALGFGVLVTVGCIVFVLVRASELVGVAEMVAVSVIRGVDVFVGVTVGGATGQEGAVAEHDAR